jgi:uncharacterized protein with PQ loop repeat
MIDILWTTKQIIGALLVFTSIFDALKYAVQANKIRKQKSAKGMSRRFTNWAISNDVVKLIYGIILIDVYIIVSSIMALGCMIYLWVETYFWYPYIHRGLSNFKRPNVILYLINSLIPNSLRKRL